MAENMERGGGELKERAGDLARDAGREVVDRANQTGARGLSSMGEALDSAADAVSKRGAAVADRGGVIKREQVDKVADGLHGAASYLKEADPKSVMEDVDRAVQEHPYRAMAVGLAVGWVIGRLWSRD